jgi:Tol biopolymer transport system component
LYLTHAIGIAGNAVHFGLQGGFDVKKTLKFTILGGVALMVALALTGCGDSHENFVFMRDTASGSALAHSTRSAAVGSKGSTALVGHAHTARLRASVAADIAVGTNDVYKGNAGSTSITKLNSASGAYMNVRLSPDGKSVGFTAYDSNGYLQVFIASVNNFDNPTQLTTGTTYDYFGLSFTPDGKFIVVTTYDTTDGDIDTFTAINLADDTLETVTPPGFAYVWYPWVTPDNLHIVFEGLPLTGFSNAGIYMCDADGSNPVRLTNLDDLVWDWAPSLTRDGKTIAFIREEDTGDYVYSVPIEGEDGVSATQLTDDGTDDFLEALDHQIVFESYIDNEATTGNDNIYSVRSTGSSTVKRVTNTDMWDGFIDFSNF